MGDPPPHIARYLHREAELRGASASSAAAARAAAALPFYARESNGGGGGGAAAAAQEARERLAKLTSTAEQLLAVRRERLRAQREEEMKNYALELAALGLAVQGTR